MLGLLILWPDVARATDQAVIIMYHRFDEQDYPTTNIRLEQFDEHLAELTSGKYTVMSLPDIVAAMKAGRTMEVDATSARGTKTAHTYSLIGITAALNKISTCN